MKTLYVRLIAVPFIVFISLSLGSISQVAGERDGSEIAADRDSNKAQLNKARVVDAYGKLQLSFEVNKGQADRSVQFLSRGPRYTLFLTPTEAVLLLKAGHSQLISKPFVQPVSSGLENTASKAAVLRIRLEHPNSNAKVSGLDELAGKSNYFIGNDSATWLREVPTFGRVKYQDIYPGVDLVYYGNQRQLEYDFVLAPRADPRQIELSFSGAERLRLDADGNLVIRIAGGEIIEHTPVIYQEINGVTRRVSGGYDLKSGHIVGFKVAAYDRRERLTIDPRLAYSTYLGGSDLDYGQGIAVDASGNAYVTGVTTSSDFPTTAGVLQTTTNGGAFISKLNSSGTGLVYSTNLGGSLGAFGAGIAVDSSGDAYVTGSTSSSDFPTTPGALQTTFAGGSPDPVDAFVSKLNSTGSALIYSTYLGGSALDSGRAIAVNSSGDAFITGVTRSLDFPITPGALQTSSSRFTDAFVSKVNSNGTALLYSTYLHGSMGVFGVADAETVGAGIAVDSSGNAYVTGLTDSSDFPTTAGALQTIFGGDVVDAFVSKLNSSGTSLLYSTYLGGSDFDSGQGIAVDSSGNAYVTGATSSSDFPTTPGALQTAFGGNGVAGNGDAFISKLNSSGTLLLYSTYLGGSDFDSGQGIAVDSSGNAYVTGATGSSDFPTTAGVLQTTINGFSDAFIGKLNSCGTLLLYSTYLGGSDFDSGQGIAVDKSGNAYVTGQTVSSDFPTTAGAPQTAFGGGVFDAFVSKIIVCGHPKIKKDCKHGGWHRFCSPSFKNQGQCVALVNHHQSYRDDYRDIDS